MPDSTTIEQAAFEDAVSAAGADAVSERGGRIFDLEVAKHFNHLTLRNGVSLAGLGRDPGDLETFFSTALFFVSDAGVLTTLERTIFKARLEGFLTHHARWLKATCEEVYGALCGCGLVGERADRARGDECECFWSLAVARDVAAVDKVLSAWAYYDEARVRRRSRMRAQLQAKNRAVNAPAAPAADPAVDAALMAEALRAARRAMDAGEVPVGAVLAVDGNIVAAAGNEVITRHDPTAHAEILVMRRAAQLLGNERLNGAVLYVTLEPCAMCSAAMSLARIARVVWGADDPNSGGMRGAVNVIERARMNHRVAMTPGVLRADCERLLKSFFAARRAQKSAGGSVQENR